jgi:hypothetical protein
MLHLVPVDFYCTTLVGSSGNAVGTRGNSVGTQWELGGSLVGVHRERVGSM